MLPFFAAGGAISGSSFGLFYTILMQVGYNYFGKRVLKGLNEGGDLKQLLWEVQQEIQPFSDSMLDMALASMPKVIESSMDAFVNVVEKFGDQRLKEIAKSWLIPHPEGGVDVMKDLRGLFPSLPEAGGVHPSEQKKVPSGYQSKYYKAPRKSGDYSTFQRPTFKGPLGQFIKPEAYQVTAEKIRAVTPKTPFLIKRIASAERDVRMAMVAFNAARRAGNNASAKYKKQTMDNLRATKAVLRKLRALR